jgi:hypothetical protein
VSMESFLDRMRGHWWKRGHRQNQGLQRIVEPDLFETALVEFEGTFGQDPFDASRRLVRNLLDPFAERADKPAWVEITGDVIPQAGFLLRLFPNAKFINMVRDGRAVVAGTLKKVDLTDDPMKALRKWEQMIEASAHGIRSIPPDRVLTVFLDDLTALDRETTFARVAGFLETQDPGPMRGYFDSEISAERANVGRWRQRMAPADARKVDRRYRRLLRKLRRRGVDWVPEPEPVERKRLSRNSPIA